MKLEILCSKMWSLKMVFQFLKGFMTQETLYIYLICFSVNQEVKNQPAPNLLLGRLLHVWANHREKPEDFGII